MTCTTIILAVLYTLAAILAVAGILLTASLFIKDPKQGVAIIGTRMLIGLRLPDTERDFDWRQAVGPILIALSVLVTLAGNFISLVPNDNAPQPGYCVSRTYQQP